MKKITHFLLIIFSSQILFSINVNQSSFPISPTSGSTYNLTESFSTTESVLITGNVYDDVEFNCNNHKITGNLSNDFLTAGYGAQENIRFYNCNFDNFSRVFNTGGGGKTNFSFSNIKITNSLYGFYVLNGIEQTKFTNITIENITHQGFYIHSSGNGNKYQNITLKNISSSAMREYGPNVNMDGIHIDGAQVGFSLLASCDYSNFSNINIKNVQYAFNGGGLTNMNFKNIEIDNTTSDTFRHSTGSVQNSNFHNISINNSQGHAFYFHSGFGYNNFDLIKISNSYRGFGFYNGNSNFTRLDLVDISNSYISIISSPANVSITNSNLGNSTLFTGVPFPSDFYLNNNYYSNYISGDNFTVGSTIDLNPQNISFDFSSPINPPPLTTSNDVAQFPSLNIISIIISTILIIGALSI